MTNEELRSSVVRASSLTGDQIHNDLDKMSAAVTGDRDHPEGASTTVQTSFEISRLSHIDSRYVCCLCGCLPFS